MPDLNKDQIAFVTTFLGVTPERTQLHRQSNAQAQTLITVAARAESRATDALTTLADKTGGEMVGLDFRLKSEESLTRKIFDIADATGEDPAEVAKDMKDVLRYTTVFAPDKYVEGVKTTVAQLRATGHTQKKFKNTWGNKTGYLGINAVFVTPEGAMFELQFHTPDSFHAKDKGTHALYEEQRRYPPGTPRYLELERLQQDVFNQVVRPDGAADLK